MKAKTLIVVTVLAVLALLLSMAVTAQGPQPPTPPSGPDMPEALPPLPQRGRGAGSEGLGVRAAQQGHNVELVGQIGGFTWAVAVQGNYAYIGVGPRLVILDVSDPSHPAVVGQTGVLPDVVVGVAVAGSYAYVADWERGLRIIDVSDPAHPSEAGSYDTPGYS